MSRLMRKREKEEQTRLDMFRKVSKIWRNHMVRNVIAALIVIQLILSSTGIGELLTRATEDLPVDLEGQVTIQEVNIFIDNGLKEPTYIVKKSQATGNPLPANEDKIHFEISWALNEEYQTMIPAGSFMNLKLPWESVDFRKTENNVVKDGEFILGVWGIKPSEPLHLVFDEIDPKGCNIRGVFEFTGATGKLREKAITLEIATEKFTVNTSGFISPSPSFVAIPPPTEGPSSDDSPSSDSSPEDPVPERSGGGEKPSGREMSTVIPRVSINKTIDGVPIQQWFEENLSIAHYESALEVITFDVYYLGVADPDQEDSGFDANTIFEGLLQGGATPDFQDIQLVDGKIVFDPEITGWYAIMENPLSEMSGVFAKVSPLFVYVSRTGISSSILQEDSNKKMFVYSIPYEIGSMNATIQNEYGKYFKEPGSQQRQLQVIYSDGCIERGPNKPDGSGQQLCTEGFITVIGADGTSKGNTWGGEPFYSMCADLGAHFVSGSYTFDNLNHYFLDRDIEYLVSVFDYINRMNGSGDFLMTADGRALAQVILWNKVIERDHNEGFTDSWKHPEGCEHEGVGGIVKVLGQGDWFTQAYAAFIECALGHQEGIDEACAFCGGCLDVQEFYIDLYIANKNNSGDRAYVSNVLFVVGTGDEEKVNQQRQLVVFFDEGVSFDNHYVYNGSLELPMRKVIASNVSGFKGQEFEFIVTQVEGLEGKAGETPVAGSEVISHGLWIEDSAKVTDFTIQLPHLTPELSESFDAIDRTYFFRITENQTGSLPGGWQYSTTTYWIEVVAREVEDENGLRKVECEIIKKISSDEEEVGERITFTNQYHVDGPGSVIISGKKEVTGINPQGDDRAVSGRIFTFTVTEVTGWGETTPLEGGWRESVEVVGGTTFGTGEFTISIDDLTVEDSPYYFMVTEKTPLIISMGWEYSKTIYFVEVIVKDNGDGTSEAMVKTAMLEEGTGSLLELEEEEVITFVNTYVSPFVEALHISVEVYKDTIRRTSAAYVSLPGKEGFNNVGNQDEHYRYDVHFRSTSNVAADEFVVDDPLENVAMGHVRIEGLWTPVVWGSTDGLFNVWVKTNKTNDNITYSTATVRRNTHLSAAFPNTGYKLWARNLRTDQQYYLDVSSLNLAEGEYITAIRFEYGGVEVGFTSMNTYRDSWNGEHRTESKGPIDLPSINKDKIVPLNPMDVVPQSANISPILSVAGVMDQMFAPAGGVQGIGGRTEAIEGTSKAGGEREQEESVYANTNWNSIRGDRVDWTPHPSSPFYPSDPGAATSLKEAELKPASYLVSATSAMRNEEIVSSAIARIAKLHNGIYLKDHDQDAVVTRVITTFDTGAKGYQPGDYKIESSFVDHARREGFDIRTIGGREALIRRIVEGRHVPKLGDSFSQILMVMGIVSGVSLMVLVLLFDTRRKERAQRRESLLENTRKREQKRKAIRKGVKGFMLLLLLGALLAPVGRVHAETIFHPVLLTSDEEELSENITIEYRYYEGEESELVIRDTITQFGRVYRLVETSEPVLEQTLPRTRTYTFKIDGTLSKEDLALIDGLEDWITITPVEKVFEREVDKTIVISGLPTNEVEYLAQTKEFQVAAAQEPSLQTTKALTRAGVSFEVEAYEDSGLARSLPSSYKATIVYRGTETYTEVIYYLAEVTYQKKETIGEMNQYIVKAIYAPTEGRSDVDVIVPGEIEEDDDLPSQVVDLITEDAKEVPEASLQEKTLEELKDAGVPLAQLGDEEVPLYGFPGMPVWALANLIMLILAAILAGITLVRMLVRKITDVDQVSLKIRSSGGDDKEDKASPSQMYKTYRLTWFVLVILSAILMGVLFMFTQDIHNLMVLFDIWSVAFGAILAAGLLGAVLSFKRIRRQIRTFRV